MSGLAEHVGDMLAGLGTVVCKRYFGGTGIWLDGVMVGAVLSGVFYLRVSPGESALLRAGGGQKFTYSTRRGTVTVGKMVSVPDAIMENQSELAGLVADLSIRNNPTRPR